MVSCPNCGEETNGAHCQWCNHPIVSGSTTRLPKAEKLASKEVELAAKEKAKVAEGLAKKQAERAAILNAIREFEEAGRAEEQAKKQAELEAKEKAKQEAEAAKKTEEFNNILDDCLERLLFKGETIEQCLQSYPEYAADIEPLLRTAMATKQAKKQVELEATDG